MKLKKYMLSTPRKQSQTSNININKAEKHQSSKPIILLMKTFVTIPFGMIYANKIVLLKYYIQGRQQSKRY